MYQYKAILSLTYWTMASCREIRFKINRSSKSSIDRPLDSFILRFTIKDAFPTILTLPW